MFSAVNNSRINNGQENVYGSENCPAAAGKICGCEGSFFMVM
ncbi:MAG: hypothetical protein ACLR6B_14375 [Blautia sp.]